MSGPYTCLVCGYYPVIDIADHDCHDGFKFDQSIELEANEYEPGWCVRKGDFWDDARRTSDEVKTWPAWKRNGSAVDRRRD